MASNRHNSGGKLTSKVFEILDKNGLSYQDYFNLFEKNRNQNLNSSSTEEEIVRINNIKLNYQRSLRIHKTYNPSEKIIDTIKQIVSPQIWMIISENWCGDSAQNIPYIIEFVKHNPLIEIKMILRDQNPDIMDEYLTDGNLRSIPKLIAFDIDGNEIFQWGPRPRSANNLVANAKKEGILKEEYMKLLHKWYANNKGEELESELLELITENIFTNN